MYLISIDVVHPLVDDDHASPVRPEVVCQVAVAHVEAAAVLLQEGVVVLDIVGGLDVDGVLAVGPAPLLARSLHRHV